MGIHGLSFYVKSNPNLSRNQQWKKSDQIVDQFIIDGNAFIYHLAYEHRAYWTHGGQYAHISSIVSQKINALQKAGIQPTFLFDGALPQGKEETRLRRYKNYLEKSETACWSLSQINSSNQGNRIDLDDNNYYGELFLIPPLTLETCIQTIKQHPNFELIHCQYEADGEVALLAEKRNAYLVSQDSDMHVSPHIGKGYIPLDLLKIPSPEEPNAIVSANVFHPEQLASLLKLDIDLLPLFGTLLGNDYLESKLIRGPIKAWAASAGIQTPKHQSILWPKIVSELILHCQGNNNKGDKSTLIKNVVEQLEPIIAQTSTRVKEEKLTDLEEKIVHSIYRYDPHNPLIPPQPEQQSMDEIGKITCQVGQGLSRQSMDVIAGKSFWCTLFLEDMERESCWDISRSLRQDLYGLIALRLGITKINVKEYVREKHHLKSQQVGGTAEEHVSLSANVSKRDYFLRAHVTSWENLTTTFQNQPVVQPLILCLRYLIYYGSLQSGGRLFNHEVIAFILANLRSLAPALGFKKDDIPHLGDLGVPALTKRALHLTAQYQTILYSSHLLAQILDFPIYTANRLTYMYDGLLLHYYIELTLGGASMAKLMSGLPAAFSLLFRQVYISVMDGLDNKVRLVYDYSIPRTLSGNWEITNSKPKRLKPEKKEAKSKKKKSEIRQPMKGNAFDVLSFGCNFDE